MLARRLLGSGNDGSVDCGYGAPWVTSLALSAFSQFWFWRKVGLLATVEQVATIGFHDRGDLVDLVLGGRVRVEDHRCAAVGVLGDLAVAELRVLQRVECVQLLLGRVDDDAVEADVVVVAGVPGRLGRTRLAGEARNLRDAGRPGAASRLDRVMAVTDRCRRRDGQPRDARDALRSR